jgi:hypothetical protein
MELVRKKPEGEYMLKRSIKMVVLSAAIAFALAGCAPFGCLVR